MATLGDVLSEIFAPRPEVGGPSRLGGPEQEPLSVPVPESGPSNGMAPITATPDGAFLDALKRMFGGTPQPPDGMDARTYAAGKPIAPKPAAVDPWQTDRSGWGTDSDAGYSPQHGFITDGNDPARSAQMVPSVDRGGSVPRTNAVVPTAGPGLAPDVRGDMPIRRAGPPAAEPANSELARAFRAFFSGAAGVNPTSPGVSAFAQGAAGAMNKQYDERQKEEGSRRQREKDAFDQTLKLTKNDRDEALADNLIKYRNSRVGADGDKVRFQDIRGYNEVKNNVARDYARKVDLINKDYSLSEPDKKKAKEEAKTERDARLSEIEQQYKQRSLTPDMGKAPPQSAPKQPQNGGDGKSPQAPVMTTDPKVIEGLPKGSYFINPADGQVYQKN